MARVRARLLLTIVVAPLSALAFAATAAPAGAAITGGAGIQSTGSIVWYKAGNGAGAIGTLDATNSHVTLRGYPAFSFATGWTHVTST